MQQLDTEQSSTVRYGFSNVKGFAIAVALLIAASFISGNQAKKRRAVNENSTIQYDLSRFEKHIQDSKKLLKKNRP